MKLIVIIYYLGALWLGGWLVNASSQAIALSAALADERSPSNVAATRGRELLEKWTFGWYTGALDEKLSRAAARENLALVRSRITVISASLIALTGAFLLLCWHYRRKHAHAQQYLGLNLLGVAAIFLGVGAIAPLLTITAHQEVPVLGKIIFSYETKSLIGTILTLTKSGNLLIASLLALFSIALPVLKLGVTGATALLAGRNPEHPFVKRAAPLVQHLGKWSMTDVFVVAIMVAFLSAERAEATNAVIGPGLYFFAGHVIVGILASIVVSRSVRTIG